MYVAQTGLELAILVPPPYMYQQCLAYFSFFNCKSSICFNAENLDNTAEQSYLTFKKKKKKGTSGQVW
jgi:hypothetical protein